MAWDAAKHVPSTLAGAARVAGSVLAPGPWFRRPGTLAVLEKRRGGWLYRAVLITRAWPGHPLDRLLPVVGPDDRRALLDALGRYVREIHAAGFRDRNMDLRNLLAGRAEQGGWQIAKIDSPRFRIVAPGTQTDRAVRYDRRRLAASLREVGIEPESAPV